MRLRPLSLIVLGLVLGLSEYSRAADGPTVRLAVVGDVMLDEEPGEVVARGGNPFAGFAEELKKADIAVANLECVVATGGEKVQKSYNFRAHPRCLGVLKEHFGALDLANNHTGDYGPKALVEMIERLDQAGIPHFGAGRDLAAAHAARVLERHGLRIALLGYYESRPRALRAGADSPGVAWAEDERVVADIRDARKRHRADLVIPVLHWGWEYYTEPNERQRALAREMIDAGADLVVGGHPHVVQGAEIYRGRPIVYSLGNFAFNGFEREVAKSGWLLRATMDRDGVVDWETKVARLDEQGLPHPSRGATSPRGRRGSAAIEMGTTE